MPRSKRSPRRRTTSSKKRRSRSRSCSRRRSVYYISPWTGSSDTCEKQTEALQAQLAAAQQELVKTRDGSLVRELNTRIALLTTELNDLRAERAVPLASPTRPSAPLAPSPTMQQLRAEQARTAALTAEVTKQKQAFKAQAEQFAKVRSEMKTLQQTNAELQAVAQQWEKAAAAAEKALTEMQGRAPAQQQQWLDQELQPMLATMRAMFQQQLDRVNVELGRVNVELNLEQNNSTALQLQLTQAQNQVTKLQAQVESLTTQSGVAEETERKARAKLVAESVASVRNLTDQVRRAEEAATARETDALRRIAVLERVLQATLASWRDTQKALQAAQNQVTQLQQTLAQTRTYLQVVEGAYKDQGTRLRGMEANVTDTRAQLDEAEQELNAADQALLEAEQANERLQQLLEQQKRWRKEENAMLMEQMSSQQQETEAELETVRAELALKTESDVKALQTGYELGVESQTANFAKLTAELAKEQASHATQVEQIRKENQRVLQAKQKEHDAVIAALQASYDSLKLKLRLAKGQAAAEQSVVYRRLKGEMRKLKAQMGAEKSQYEKEMGELFERLAAREKGNLALTRQLRATNDQLTALEAQVTSTKQAASDEIRTVQALSAQALQERGSEVARLQREKEELDAVAARQLEETIRLKTEKQRELQLQGQTVLALESELRELRERLMGRADVDTRVAQLEYAIRQAQQRYDNLIAEMTCPVCLEVKDKIDQPTGKYCRHKVCAADQLLLNACPICRAPYQNVPKIVPTVQGQGDDQPLKPLVPVVADLSPMEAAQQFVHNVQDTLRNALTILPALPSWETPLDGQQQLETERLSAIETAVRALQQAVDIPDPIRAAQHVLHELHETLNTLYTNLQTLREKAPALTEFLAPQTRQRNWVNSDLVVESVRKFVADALSTITPSTNGLPAFTHDLVTNAQNVFTTAATGAENLTERALWLGEWALRTVTRTHVLVKEQYQPDPQFARILTQEQLDQRRAEVTTLANELARLMEGVQANVANLRAYARQPSESVSLNVADALEAIYELLRQMFEKVEGRFDVDQDLANEHSNTVNARLEAEETAKKSVSLTGKRMVKVEGPRVRIEALVVVDLPENLALNFVGQVTNTLLVQTEEAATYLRAVNQPVVSRLISRAGDTYVATTLASLQLIEWFKWRLVAVTQTVGGELSEQLRAVVAHLESVNYSSLLADGGMGLMRLLFKIITLVTKALTSVSTDARVAGAFLEYARPLAAFVVRLVGSGIYRTAVAAYDALERMMTSLYSFGTEAAQRAAVQLMVYYEQLSESIATFNWQENLEVLAGRLGEIMAGVYSVVNQVNQVLGRAVSAAVRSVIAFSVFFSTVAGRAVSAVWRATVEQAQNAAELLGHMLSWLRQKGATVSQELANEISALIEQLRQHDYQTPVEELARRVKKLLNNAVTLVNKVWSDGAVFRWINAQLPPLKTKIREFKDKLVQKLGEFLTLLQDALQYVAQTAVKGAVQTGRLSYTVAAQGATIATRAVTQTPGMLGSAFSSMSYVASYLPFGRASGAGAEDVAVKEEEVFQEVKEEQGYEETKEGEVEADPVCKDVLQGQRRAMVKAEMNRLENSAKAATKAAEGAVEVSGGLAAVLAKMNELRKAGTPVTELQGAIDLLKNAQKAQFRYLQYRKQYLRDCLFKSLRDADVVLVSRQQTENNAIRDLIGGSVVGHRALTRYERKALERLQAGMQRKHAVKQRWQHASRLLKAGAISRRTFEQHTTKLNGYYKDAQKDVAKGMHKLEKM